MDRPDAPLERSPAAGSNGRHPNGEVFLVSAARTPIGRFGGGLASTPAPELGAVAIRAALERAGLAADVEVDEVLMGQVVQAGTGQAPARQAALAAGLAATTTATTINRVCGSGLKAIMLAASAIRAGDGELYVAGGQENMSLAPYLLPKGRFGYRLGDGAVEDAVLKDALTCAFGNCAMGTHAERVAAWAGLTRTELDEFALLSHRKAVAAIDAGRFEAELAPVTVRDAKGRDSLVGQDEGPRRDTSLEALGRLRPAFEAPAATERPPTGFPARSARASAQSVGASSPSPELMVTAGNSPGITDGAAATVVASERTVERFHLQPLARIVGYAQAELEPEWLFLAPVVGVRRLLERIELPLEAFDLIEINEAFASQTLADGRELDFDWSRVNVNGGAIALGHPVGASGARIVATLLHELRRRGGRYGLATLCLGGGGSVAMAFERV